VEIGGSGGEKRRPCGGRGGGGRGETGMYKSGKNENPCYSTTAKGKACEKGKNGKPEKTFLLARQKKHRNTTAKKNERPRTQEQVWPMVADAAQLVSRNERGARHPNSTGGVPLAGAEERPLQKNMLTSNWTYSDREKGPREAGIEKKKNLSGRGLSQSGRRKRRTTKDEAFFLGTSYP